MGKSLRWGLLGFALGSLGISIAAAPARGATRPVTVTPGAWQMSEVGGPGRRLICAASAETLLPLPVARGQCERLVLAGDPNTIVVQYRCAGRGWWRSALTVHGKRSVALETQGIVDGAPFNVSYRGRLAGTCAARTEIARQSITR